MYEPSEALVYPLLCGRTPLSPPLFKVINMVITQVKNGSPDMILTAFDGKFDEKKDEIPPGIL